MAGIQHPGALAVSMDSLISALSRFPGEGGVFGAVTVGDDFFLLVRESGQGRWILLSDGAASWDWSLAEEAVDMLGLSDDDVEELEPGGILGCWRTSGQGRGTRTAVFERGSCG